jgi:membrane protease YdiL (CAAX protease family)
MTPDPSPPEFPLRHWFLDPQHRLRNGWWMLIFIACIGLTRVAYKPVAGFLRESGLPEFWLEPLPFLFSLLAVFLVTRLRRESVASVGFRLDARWFGEAVAGTAIGGLAILVITALIWSVGGVRFTLDPARSVEALSLGLWMFLWVALLEENLFRGFLFQRLIDGAGFWVAQLCFAALFAVGHWGNPGMEDATLVWASLDLALGAILFGIAYLKTCSLALPVGLHLGWNWTQGNLLGFGVSGVEQAGWWQPAFQGLPQWVTGGEFGPEASVFAVLVDVVLIVALWRWRGTAPAEART